MLTTSRLARRVGLVTAVLFATGLVVSSHLPGEQGVFGLVLAGPVVVFFVSSATAAAVARSFRVGVQAAAWTALMTVLFTFVAWIAEAWRWHHTGAGLLLDGEGGYPVSANLADAVFWSLVFLPVWGLPFGVFGAKFGVIQLRPPTGEAAAPAPAPQSPAGVIEL